MGPKKNSTEEQIHMMMVLGRLEYVVSCHGHGHHYLQYHAMTPDYLLH